MNDKEEIVQMAAKYPERQQPEKPSPPWFGGLILASLTLATIWILTYTLAPLPGQQTLGGWNYVIVGACVAAFIGLSMDWRGEPRENRQTAEQNGLPKTGGPRR